MNNQVYIRIVATYTFADKLEIGFEKGNPPDEFGHFKEDITVCREDSSLGITCDITTKRTFLITDLVKAQPKYQDKYSIVAASSTLDLAIDVNSLVTNGTGWKPQGGIYRINDYYYQAIARD